LASAGPIREVIGRIFLSVGLLAPLVLVPASASAAPPLVETAALPPVPVQQQVVPDLSGLDGKYVPGELLVRYKRNLPGAHLQAISVQQGIRPLSATHDGSVHRVAVTGDLGIALASLQADPRVQTVQPNWLYTLPPSLHRQPPLRKGEAGGAKPLLVPNDEFYQGMDAFFEGAGPLDFQRWYLGDTLLRAESAWDLTTGRADVVVAVIDSGVDLDHPDLAANIWVNPGEVPGNGLDDDENGFVDDVNGWDFYSNDSDPNPDLGDGIQGDRNVAHGTLVAGTIAAVGNDGVGVTGAAWNVQIMALKVFTDDGFADDFGILEAITYAAENVADVINLSLGALLNEPVPVADPLTEAVIAAAHSAGVVVIAAAGNESSSNPSTPASATHAISVGANDYGSVYWAFTGAPWGTDPSGRAFFSNYGRYVDVVAPGVRTLSTYVFSQADSNQFGDPP